MERHPNVIHVDDLPVQDIELGELRSRRQRLAGAAGATAIGVSRWRIQPGGRSTPAHIHSDEEEVFFVLAGRGTLWQGGAEHAISAGDCLVFPTDGEAHTLFAADDAELDVLAFAEGSQTHITYIPRSQMYFLGARWLPADRPNPFKVEADLPGLERAEPTPRPSNVVSSDDAPWDEYDDPGYEGREQRLSRAAGSHRVGLRRVRLAPGNASCPAHFHLSEEECFYVLSGAGELALGDDAVPLRPGSFAVRPPASHVAHQVRASGDGLEYLAFGQNQAQDVVFYPRSNKVNISGLMFRIEPVEYFDGEP